MKKVWLLMLLLSGIVLLAGCLETNDPTETPVVTEEIQQLATVEVYDLDNVLVFTEEISFLEDDTRSTIEIIEAHIDFIYAVFDFGVFVYGVGGFFPKEYGVSFNYWLGLYINNISSSVGIDGVVLEDGMVISFKEQTMFDQVDQAVDQLIYLFMANHLSTYINDTYIHHDVLAAIVKLSLMGYDTPHLSTLIDREHLDDYLLTLESEAIGQTFKKAVIEAGFGIDDLETKTALEDMAPTNPYDATSLLNALFVVRSESLLIGQIHDQLINDLPEYMDPDYAGMLLVALAPYSETSETVILDMMTFIQTQQTNQGILSWGNANAASTAAVILGLIAHGENPRDQAYTVEDVDLIEALLLYETNAAFYWLIDDAEADMNFSTPQAFAALVAYKLYRDVWGSPPVYLYDLIDLNNA